MRIIDLSQEIYPGMPVFDGHPRMTMEPAGTRRVPIETESGPAEWVSVHELRLSEHTGTHVDAFSHFGPEWIEKSVETMPLEMFLTEAVCLDFSAKRLKDLITIEDVEASLGKAGLAIEPGDTVLIRTDHYLRHYADLHWSDGPGISEELAGWFGERRISGFGVETRSPGLIGQGNREIHVIGGQMGYTHYENLVNLHLLPLGRRFVFIAMPLKIRGGTGSPVRAVALLDCALCDSAAPREVRPAR